MGSEVVIGTVPLWDSCVPQYTSVVTEEPIASSTRPSQEPRKSNHTYNLQ